MDKINKILIGTHNKGKFKEISDLLPKTIEKFSPESFNLDSPVENGKTFKENSEIKANFFCNKTNLITLSDDSGLEIESLNGDPGIHSARWAKKYGSFYKAMRFILKKMKNNRNRSATFVCSLSLKYPKGKIITVTGQIKGSIAKRILGSRGFGYDPIFIPLSKSITFGQMPKAKKINIDHRYIAFKKLKRKIKIF